MYLFESHVLEHQKCVTLPFPPLSILMLVMNFKVMPMGIFVEIMYHFRTIVWMLILFLMPMNE